MPQIMSLDYVPNDKSVRRYHHNPGYHRCFPWDYGHADRRSAVIDSNAIYRQWGVKTWVQR